MSAEQFFATEETCFALVRQRGAEKKAYFDSVKMTQLSFRRVFVVVFESFTPAKRELPLTFPIQLKLGRNNNAFLHEFCNFRKTEEQINFSLRRAREGKALASGHGIAN